MICPKDLRALSVHPEPAVSWHLCRFRRARRSPPHPHQYLGAGRATADDARSAARLPRGRSRGARSRAPWFTRRQSFERSVYSN